jgi:hypothetical protein
MANQTLNDAISFLETRLQTIADLHGKVKVTLEDEPYPGVIKDYGARIYLTDNPKEIIRKKLGNIVHEIWRIKVDIIINRSLKSREQYSDAKGVSYWENLVFSTLLHQRNNGAFVNSFWTFERSEKLADSIIVHGEWTCELENIY